MDAFVRELEQLAVDGHVDSLLAKVKEIVPSYTGYLKDGQAGVLEFDGELPKPVAPANGAATPLPGHQWIERPA